MSEQQQQNEVVGNLGGADLGFDSDPGLDQPAAAPKPRPRIDRTNVLASGLAIAMVLFFTGLFLANQHFNSVVAGGLSSVGDRTSKLEVAVAELQGRADATDENVGQLQSAAHAAADELLKAAQATEEIDSRLDARVEAENQKLRQQLGYIRGVNPECDLAKLSSAAVEKLLHDGVLNVEPKIEAEYNRLVANAATFGQKTAVRATVKLMEVEQKLTAIDTKADQALDAGETAVEAVGVIVSRQPKLPVVGRSISAKTKAEVKSDLQNYWDSHASPAVAARAAAAK
ncbi:MAG: hypothetical protein WC517_01650 [Patescibacteria group bacterium]